MTVEAPYLALSSLPSCLAKRSAVPVCVPYNMRTTGLLGSIACAAAAALAAAAAFFALVALTVLSTSNLLLDDFSTDRMTAQNTTSAVDSAASSRCSGTSVSTIAMFNPPSRLPSDQQYAATSFGRRRGRSTAVYPTPAHLQRYRTSGKVIATQGSPLPSVLFATVKRIAIVFVCVTTDVALEQASHSILPVACVEYVRGSDLVVSCDVWADVKVTNCWEESGRWHDRSEASTAEASRRHGKLQEQQKWTKAVRAQG
eukprot:361497-Chlamydomonas_euryale.AAC.5